MSFPPATEMFQFAGFASPPYEFRRRYPLQGGLPHSEIPGSTIARISPGLFAACHVLHRLSVPRHPPDALTLRLSATPNGKDHSDIRKQMSDIRSQNHSVRQTLLSEDTSRGSPGTTSRPYTRSPATVTQLASLRLSISKRLRAQSRMPRRQIQVFSPRFRLHQMQSPSAFCCAKRLSAPRTVRLAVKPRGLTRSGGDRNRTDDPLLAKQVLSQLSYTPVPDDSHRSEIRTEID